MQKTETQFITHLRRLLPAHCLVTSKEQLRVYECDGLTAIRRLPLAAVLPESLDQVKLILAGCREYSVPLVPRGAGTSLSGGATPVKNGIVMSMARFNRILEIKPENLTAVVEPGVRNLAISEAVEHHNLYYAPDPSSQIACSIGGNVAENAGGLHCLKYGLTVHNVLAVELLTIDGEQMWIGAESYDSPGYDLLSLIHGSEGLLGIILKIVVRLQVKPEVAKLLVAAFDSVEVAGEAVTRVISSGIIPGGLEMMDNAAIRAAEDFVHAGYPVDAAALLLCELDGLEAGVDQQRVKVEALLQDAGAVSIQLAGSEEQRLKLWSGRKSAFPAVGRISPDYLCMDGTIPRSQLGRVLTRIQELSSEYGLQIANVFHAGDGNLHPLILYDANRPGELKNAEECGARILEFCVEVGGTITGEHGVGVEKIDQMCVQFRPLELAQFHAIRTAFDSDGLLNPGKAVPTLVRCAELGFMHVHEGQLPFPELERF